MRHLLRPQTCHSVGTNNPPDGMLRLNTLRSVAIDAEAEAFRLMSESACWINRDENGTLMRRILEAAAPARKSYILDLRDELRAFVGQRLRFNLRLAHRTLFQHERTRCRWLWLYSLRDVKANLICFV